MMWSIFGKLKLGKGERKFTKTVEAKSENDAKGKVYSLFGSLNGVRRSSVQIERVEKTGG